jgi:hypothetical protein
VGHGGLDRADAGGGGVFAGFAVVIEEVWGAGLEGLVLCEDVVGWRAYSWSSGRDMVAVDVL